MEELQEQKIYSQMSSEQFLAFKELLKKANDGLIKTNKNSLLKFFDKMNKNGWKDSRGRAIQNIVGYVTSSFNIYSYQQELAEQKLIECGLYFQGNNMHPFQ